VRPFALLRDYLLENRWRCFLFRLKGMAFYSTLMTECDEQSGTLRFGIAPMDGKAKTFLTTFSLKEGLRRWLLGLLLFQPRNGPALSRDLGDCLVGYFIRMVLSSIFSPIGSNCLAEFGSGEWRSMWAVFVFTAIFTTRTRQKKVMKTAWEPFFTHSSLLPVKKKKSFTCVLEDWIVYWPPFVSTKKKFAFMTH